MLNEWMHQVQREHNHYKAKSLWFAVAPITCVREGRWHPHFPMHHSLDHSALEITAGAYSAGYSGPWLNGVTPIQFPSSPQQLSISANAQQRVEESSVSYFKGKKTME